METVKAEQLVPPPAKEAPLAASSSSNNPMDEYKRRLEKILSSHGSASGLLDKQNLMMAEVEKMKAEPKDELPVAMEKEVCLIMKSLNKGSSPAKKLEEVVRKYAEVAVQRRGDERKVCVLQQQMSMLLEESRGSAAARSELEALCRELQGHYDTLREETLKRCRDDEEKRSEITSHFQSMLTEIQSQIETHSTRNDKLCHENSNLTDKLEGLMSQCEMREESLEKINNHRDLQHKLTEAKLQQANALLTEAEDKHRREKEYLLREAIDKTKKCYAMKEQELAMKKKLTLYAQKFDEFQATLSKSNEIYVRFKSEMDNMSDKMKKMDKESTLWKTRFENCNKALNDMISERTEKCREYDIFVLKINKLERLCDALQRERGMLYEKIKQISKNNSNVSIKIFGDKSSDLSPFEQQELHEIGVEDPVLTEDMSRLKEEQTKLQEFANSLLNAPAHDDEEDNKEEETEDDLVASAFDHFQTKPQVKQEQLVDVKSEESVVPPSDEVTEPATSCPVEKTSEAIPTDTKPDVVPTQVMDKEVQPVKAEEEILMKPAEPTPEPEEVKTDPPTGTKPKAVVEAKVEAEPVKEQEVQAEPEEAPSAPPSKDTPKTAAASNAESAKKQTPKKKKKKNAKNAS
ncbi:beta-taxilin isoform X1 [Pseudochaenichthys georgianus]|uniref:beta-taxilin isoform X1 n=1 Tax=Pseudochaenichthys georgianus TaxID=52239 RepID=UPI00146F6B56|nr:beta-taxilin isoform X1 [Pseudochaenichthys georgianus]